MDKVIYGIFAICNGTSKEWEETDPVLEKGEIGYDSSTNRLKVGDGESRWSKLDWVRGKTDINNIFAKDIGIDKINTLDSNNVQNALEELMLKNNTNVESIESLKQNKTNKADEKMMVEDFSFKTNGDEIFATVNKYNAGDLTDNTSAPDKKVLPLATDTTAGAMSPSDYAQIRANKEAIERLDNDSVRLLYTEKENPTAEEIDAFVISKGYKTPYKGVAVVVDKTFNIWHFYEGGIGWHDDGIDTVIQFTNDKAGIIKGANIDGKVYAETDGTGSVKGWNAVKTDISTNTNDITNLKSNLNNHIDNKANPHGVTAEQVNTYTKEVIDEKLDNVTQPFDEPESLQASEKFLSDTEDDTYFIHTLGNTEQDVSPNLFDSDTYYSDTSALVTDKYCVYNKTTKGVTRFKNDYLPYTLHEKTTINSRYLYIRLSKLNSNDCRVSIWDLDGNKIYESYNQSYTNAIDLGKEYKDVYILFPPKGSEVYPQELGTIMLTKEPYNGEFQPYTGQPSPDNPIEVKSVVSPIEVKSQGANLFDLSKCYIKNNENTNSKLEGQTLYMSSTDYNGFYSIGNLKNMLKNVSIGDKIRFIIDTNSEQKTMYSYGLGKQIQNNQVITITKEILEKNTVLYSSPAGQEHYFKVMFTPESNTSNVWQPYVEPITTTYSIKDKDGIVHEMNGIGGVHDQLVFKGDKWYLEKKFYKYTLSGNDAWNKSSYTNRFGMDFNAPLYKYTSYLSSIGYTTLVNSYLRDGFVDGAIARTNGSGVSLYYNTGNLGTKHIYVDYINENLADFKSYLNRVKPQIVYELETPEYYELDPTEVVKMFAKTFSGGTNLSITSTKATPLIDFKNLLLVGEHDNVVIKKNGKILDVHTCSDNVGMRNGLTLEETMATIPTMEVLNRELDNKQPKGNYLTEHQDISGKADTTYVDSELDKKLDKTTAAGTYVSAKEKQTFTDIEQLRANNNINHHKTITLNHPGWYKICKSTGSGLTEIKLSGAWASQEPPSTGIILVKSGYYRSPYVALSTDFNRPSTITKVRYIRNTREIEIYYKLSVGNYVTSEYQQTTMDEYPSDLNFEEDTNTYTPEQYIELEVHSGYNTTGDIYVNNESLSTLIGNNTSAIDTKLNGEFLPLSATNRKGYDILQGKYLCMFGGAVSGVFYLMKDGTTTEEHAFRVLYLSQGWNGILITYVDIVSGNPVIKTIDTDSTKTTRIEFKGYGTITRIGGNYGR